MKGRSSKPPSSRSYAVNRERVCMSITPYMFNEFAIVDEPSETMEEDVTVQSLSVQNMKTLLDMGYPMTSLDQLIDLFGAMRNISHPYSYTGDDITILEGNISKSHMSPENLENVGICDTLPFDVVHTQHNVAEVCVGSFYDDDIICRDSYQVNMSCSSAATMDTGYELLRQAMSERTWKDNTDGLPTLFIPFSDNMNMLHSSTPNGDSTNEKPSDGRYQKPNQDDLTVIQEHMQNYVCYLVIVVIMLFVVILLWLCYLVIVMLSCYNISGNGAVSDCSHTVLETYLLLGQPSTIILPNLKLLG